MTARIFSLLSGLVLLGLTLAEFLAQLSGSIFVVSTTPLIVFHALAGIAGVIGYFQERRFVRGYAQLVGGAAFLFAVLGFIPAQAGSLAAGLVHGQAVPMVELVLHLVIGVAGLFAGFGTDREHQ